MKRSHVFAVLGVALAAGSSALAAPQPYAGGVYNQNFDTLPNSPSTTTTITGRGPHEFSAAPLSLSGLDGWQYGNPTGSSGNTEFRAQDGSLAGNAGRGVISFGTTGSNERSLGTLATSNQINNFGLVLTNTSGQVLDSFTLSYTGEQWRRGNVASPNEITFSYGVGAAGISSGGLTPVASLGFAAPNTQASPTEVALDGNLPANQVAVSGKITGLNWQPGQTLVLAWFGEDQSGQDDGLAIDNLSLSAQAVPEPTTVSLAVVAALGGLALVARRRR